MTVGFVLSRLRPYLPQLALICAVTLLGSLATLSVPLLAGRLLSGIVGEAAIDMRATLALLVGALLATTLIGIAVAVLSELASGHMLAGLRREAYTHVQALPIKEHNEAKMGDLLALITFEIDSLSTFLASTIATIPSHVITATGALVLLFMIDPMLALIVPVLIPVFIIMSKLVGRRLRALALKTRDAEVALFSRAETDLELLPAIKAFAREDTYQDRYAQLIEHARRANLDQKKLEAAVQPVTTLIAALAAIAILLVGLEGAGTQARSTGEVFTFLLYAALLTRPAGALAGVYGQFQWARGTMARLVEVLAIPPEAGYSTPRTLERAEGAIAFESVSFAYPAREMVLEDVDLSIKAGEVVAITGANGIGKSTLLALLMRYYEPQAGRITLDGIDVRELNVQSLRSQIGYVPQRALLFDGTVRDNITLASDTPAAAALERAIEFSGARTFIEALPDGLDTVIGDHGVRLSGGQRQRVALARALYADPPIYVFDEATSMYDLASEAAFVDTCIRALKGCTIIIITHRPASLALADRVLEASPSGYTLIPPAQTAPA
ncbi:MAG: ABC transporter ATP-binding protein [Pseudomonadota bacterium]